MIDEMIDEMQDYIDDIIAKRIVTERRNLYDIDGLFDYYEGKVRDELHAAARDEAARDEDALRARAVKSLTKSLGKLAGKLRRMKLAGELGSKEEMDETIDATMETIEEYKIIKIMELFDL